MTTTARRALADYLALQYTFHVEADPDGGYVVLFPDLPGCMTQVESIEELPAAAEEARQLWITTEYEAGDDIPLPSQPHHYSGKFNVRLPKHLHRALAESAEREGVSLNQYVVALLARGDAQSRAEQRATFASAVYGMPGITVHVSPAAMGGSGWWAVGPVKTGLLEARDESELLIGQHVREPIATRIYQGVLFRE